MRTKLIPTITLFLVGFTAGAILGRRWRGDFADGVLTLIMLATGVMLIFLAADYLRKTSPLLPFPIRRGVGGEVGHLSFFVRDGKWVLQLQDIGRLQFFEFTIAVPQSWKKSSDGRVPRPTLDRTEALALVLFALSLAVYAITRLVALDQFPIYFFADEAIEGVLASQLLQRGLRDYQDRLLPLFFNTYGFFNPLISVYFHAAGIALFGKSIIVTRGVSAVMTLIASGALGLTLKFGFRVRYWWAAVLFLAATPAWFLHSRTAFETAMMVSFYACFLLCYVLYRYRSPRFLYPALVFAAATFYSYGNGQLVIGLTGVLLLLSDLRYHIQNWRTALVGAALLVILALPYVQYGRDHPNEAAYHLRTLDTFVLRQIPLEQKVSQLIRQYAYGLSPPYWFIPNENDLARHRMKDYGNIALWALPFFLVGIAVCLRQIKSSAHRVALIAALAAPIGGAITQVAITRILAFVVPAAIFATLGLDFLIRRLRPRWQPAATAIAFIAISGASFGMLGDALNNGPLWYNDYGLYGMQWGAKQLFQVIPTFLKQSPDTTVNISPTWANGTDVFLDYFMPNEPRVKFGNVDALLADKQPLDSNMVFVMTPEELGKARASRKFKSIQINQTILYPNGTDGFYFARLAYVDNVEEIFAAEKAERRKPVVQPIQLNGEIVTVIHSLLDAGQLSNLFDNDTFTLVRVAEANPGVLEFIFPTPRRISGIAMDTGTMDFVLAAVLYPDTDAEPVTFNQVFRGLPADPHVEMTFDNAPPLVSKVRVQVTALDVGGIFKIHIRELRFR